MSKRIIAIWAQDNNHLIGANNTLPWHLPADLKQFKATTSGHAILMGRVTFDGMKRRLLPNRETLILTRDYQYQVDGARVFHVPKDVLDWFSQQDKNLYIVGGSEIYKLFMPYCDALQITTIDHEFEGDTFFPIYDLSAFTLVETTNYPKNEENPYPFTVTKWEKRE